ncbi:hypothetical protein BABINDRAFT_166643 [Babjeviella inositovora NRRL Y-12698]|uniref:Uncharacterized protein n=1 Tax=Babjeviella inositovora NRRL Y-12698 TaxID=984486 RepID=A0A1E3QRN4_9ASCO|nr:uncharacterized protein BABINDRAFT_166643 [Babjeviella inositovora NRRL Y-12698]ODQ80298.1 hypothetical protein BABINDRAFT_166643 [Babjeviella inositovora NRRL Y-12698]
MLSTVRCLRSPVLRGLSHSRAARFHTSSVCRNERPHNLFQTPFLDSAVFAVKVRESLAGPLPRETVLAALENVRILQDNVLIGDKFSDESKAQIAELSGMAMEIFNAPNVAMDDAFLKTYFLTIKPHIDDTLQAMKVFYKRNPTGHIDRITAMIPFRQFLLRNELDACFRIIDYTTNHKRYHRYLQKQLHRKIGYTAGFGLVGLGVLDRVLRSVIPDDDPTLFTNFYTMLAAYLANAAFMGSIAFGSIMSKNKDNFLNWQPGTLQRHWYFHQDEMKMCSAIAEFDAEFNGKDGYATKDVMDECLSRKMEPATNIEEFMLQEYWVRQGDGFEWVEPDQDPADVLIVQHLKQYIPEKLGEKLQWANKLIGASETSERSEDAKGIVSSGAQPAV